MAESMEQALAKLLDAYDERRRGDVAREQKSRDDETRFLEQFAELRRSVIRPVFEAAGRVLEERGHRYSIAEQEFSAASAGSIREASIALRVVASGTKAGLHEDQESLSITTRHYNRTLWVNAGESAKSGGIAGAKGAYPPEKVTRELVEDELLQFVARVVAT